MNKSFKKALVLGLTSVCLASSAMAADAPKATVKTYDVNGGKIHAFIPYSGDVSNIIELKDKVILVDLQLTKSATKELDTYIKSLKKPLKSIIIPTHPIGDETFKGVPNYQSKELDASVKEKKIDFYIDYFGKMFGEDMVRSTVTATNILKEGESTIDGLKVISTTNGKAFPAESDLVFPELNVYFAHLAADNTHFIIPSKESIPALITKWEGIKAKKYSLVLSSHLHAVDNKGVEFLINYLKTADKIVKSNATKDGYKEQMKKAYPTAGIEHFLNMSADNIYGNNK